MSTLVGLKQDGKIYLGADSRASTEDGEVRPKTFKKIFRNGTYVIGFIGSVRGGQILYPEYAEMPDDVMDVPDFIRVHCDEKGCLGINEHQMSMHGCNYIFAYQGRMYEILIDFQMSEIDNYTAVGSGSSYAFGSLHTTEDMKLDGQTRVKWALEAAAMFDGATGAPFDIKVI